MTKDLCSSRQRTITMASVSISLLVAVAVLTGVNTVTAFDWAGNDPSLTQLATLPPPDESAIPNLMNFLNCLQPGGDPHTQLIDAVPNNDKEPLRDMFPGIGPPMAMITCDMLKQAASGAQTLIYQLATGQISPQQFIKGLMDLNPMITTLVMDIIKDAKKALDEVIKNLPPDSPLKSILQQVAALVHFVLKLETCNRRAI